MLYASFVFAWSKSGILLLLMQQLMICSKVWSVAEREREIWLKPPEITMNAFGVVSSLTVMGRVKSIICSYRHGSYNTAFSIFLHCPSLLYFNWKEIVCTPFCFMFSTGAVSPSFPLLWVCQLCQRAVYRFGPRQWSNTHHSNSSAWWLRPAARWPFIINQTSLPAVYLACI